MPADRAMLFRLATSARLERAARAVPLTERLAWRAASRYVAGTTAVAAVRTAQDLRDRGAGSSIDQFGELVQDIATAARVASGYLELADQVSALPADTWLSVDLSHLGLDVRLHARGDRRAPVRGRASGRGSPRDVLAASNLGGRGRSGPAQQLPPPGHAWRRASIRLEGVEQLLGVRPANLDDLVARGIPVRVYVPFGDDWFRYWMRRLAESRGA